MNKHIVLLVPGFAADESDDSCIPPLQVMLLEFQKQFPGIKFSVIAFQYPFREKAYRWNGIDVYPCNGRNRKSVFRFLTWRKAEKVFRKLHEENRVDLVHSFWLTECALAGERVHRRFGVPHLNTLMGQDVLEENSYLRLEALQKVPAIALSELHAKYFERYGKRKPVAVIPWGTETIRVDSTVKDIDVLVAGSLIPLKQTEFAIEAAAVLVKEFPDLKMVIAGDGEERKALEKKVNESGLQKNVTFTGKISRAEVLKWMGRSKMLLHPSRYESFSYVFAEAMEVGIPIVSFAVGIAKPGASWTVVKDKTEIAPAVKRFLANGGNNSEKILVSETVRAYRKIYREMIERG